MTIDELIENFEFLEDWEDKYRYIIELGEKLPPLEDKYKTDSYKVQGCTSQVWLVPDQQEGRLVFRGDSDAMIVRGLVAIVLMIYGNKSAQEIKAIAVEDIFAKLGLQDHLSPSRRNGLFSLVEKIKDYC